MTVYDCTFFIQDALARSGITDLHPAADLGASARPRISFPRNHIRGVDLDSAKANIEEAAAADPAAMLKPST